MLAAVHLARSSAQAVGLPLCLSDLNLSAEDSSKLDIVVLACLGKPNLCLNMPMDLTADMIRAAILQTDERGRAAKAAAAQ
jgi:glycerol dehydrogenase-like iron-containing ADH family enzyme